MKSTVVVSVLACLLWASGVEAFESYSEAWKAGKKLYDTRKYTEAAPVLEQAAELAKKPGDKVAATMCVGYCLYNSRQYDKALPVFEKALAMEGVSKGYQGIAWRYVGYVQTRKKAYEKALEAYRKSEQTAPGSKNKCRALHGVAETYVALKQPEKAVETYEKAAALPKLHPAYQSTALRCLGSLYASRKQYDKAREAFERATAVPKAGPRYTVHAWIAQADLEIALKQYGKARELLDKALAEKKVPKWLAKRRDRVKQRLDKIGGGAGK